METCANYVSGDQMFFSSDERRWVTRIRKLAEQHPDEVTILAQPENNGGCIYAKMPVNYLRIQPKKACHMTDEQKLIAAQRMRNCVLKQDVQSCTDTNKTATLG